MAKIGPPRRLDEIRRGVPMTPAAQEDRAQTPSLQDELILGGRRYRLVPVESADHAVPVQDPLPSITDLLTERETQIVFQVAQGRVNKQIADDLRISEWTVSTHLRRIFAKLGVDTRAAMVSRCASLLRNPLPRLRPPR